MAYRSRRAANGRRALAKDVVYHRKFVRGLGLTQSKLAGGKSGKEGLAGGTLDLPPAKPRSAPCLPRTRAAPCKRAIGAVN